MRKTPEKFNQFVDVSLQGKVGRQGILPQQMLHKDMLIKAIS